MQIKNIYYKYCQPWRLWFIFKMIINLIITVSEIVSACLTKVKTGIQGSTFVFQLITWSIIAPIAIHTKWDFNTIRKIIKFLNFFVDSMSVSYKHLMRNLFNITIILIFHHSPQLERSSWAKRMLLPHLLTSTNMLY